MATFYCRLNAPRPTFAFDMMPDEGALMQAHAEYWRAGITNGEVVCFGLVGDPSGPFGLGILETEGEPQAQAFTDADPVIAAGRGFSYDVWPMPFGVSSRAPR